MQHFNGNSHVLFLNIPVLSGLGSLLISCSVTQTRLTPVTLGDHVSVADGGHGDDTPPEPVDDAADVGAGLGEGSPAPRRGGGEAAVLPLMRHLLREVDHGTEDDHPEDEEEDEQQQLPRRGLQS